jgi:hypothetical protein
MGRTYTAAFDNVAQAASGELISITCAAAKVICVRSIHYSQEDDYGDTNADGGRITIQRAGTVGTGGTTVNANPLDPGDAADSATVSRHHSSAGTTLTLLVAENFNWQAGFFWDPVPEDYIWLGGSDILVVRLEDTPGASHNTSMTVTFEEFG